MGSPDPRDQDAGRGAAEDGDPSAPAATGSRQVPDPTMEKFLNEQLEDYAVEWARRQRVSDKLAEARPRAGEPAAGAEGPSPELRDVDPQFIARRAEAAGERPPKAMTDVEAVQWHMWRDLVAVHQFATRLADRGLRIRPETPEGAAALAAAMSFTGDLLRLLLQGKIPAVFARKRHVRRGVRADDAVAKAAVLARMQVRAGLFAGIREAETAAARRMGIEHPTFEKIRKRSVFPRLMGLDQPEEIRKPGGPMEARLRHLAGQEPDDLAALVEAELARAVAEFREETSRHGLLFSEGKRKKVDDNFHRRKSAKIVVAKRSPRR